MNTSIIKKFVNNFKQEGEDHIRISPFASTTLGKVLSPDWRKKFFIPHVGEFLTPQCFANWLVTGDDEARHDVNLRPAVHVKEYPEFVLYAKFYQLCSMKTLLDKEMKDLPFAMYKIHTSGVKEFHRWKEYPTEIKDMIQHILDPERGSKAPYPWETNYPGLLEKVNQHIKAIAQLTLAPKPDPKPEKPAKPAKVETEAPPKPGMMSVVDQVDISDEELDRQAAERLRKRDARNNNSLSDEELDRKAEERLRKRGLLK